MFVLGLPLHILRKIMLLVLPLRNMRKILQFVDSGWCHCGFFLYASCARSLSMALRLPSLLLHGFSCSTTNICCHIELMCIHIWCGSTLFSSRIERLSRCFLFSFLWMNNIKTFVVVSSFPLFEWTSSRHLLMFVVFLPSNNHCQLFCFFFFDIGVLKNLPSTRVLYFLPVCILPHPRSRILRFQAIVDNISIRDMQNLILWYWFKLQN